MGGLRLIATFGWFLQIIAATAALTALAALALDEPASARVFFASAVLMAFIATALVVGFRGRGAPSRRRHGLALALASWIVLPAFAALPFIVLAETGLIAGYFEAVSVFTTTGSTALGSIDQIPRALILWRAQLEWLGGALTIVMAAAAVSVSGDTGEGGIHLLSSGLANVERLKAIARVILPVYALLTVLCYTALLLSGLAAFDAVALSLSTISTGGAMPHDGDISAYQVPALAPLMCVFLILGAANFALLSDPRGTANWLYHNRSTVMTRIALVFSVFAILTIAFAGYADPAEISGAKVVFEAIFTTVSLITTSA
ncbi:MAG: TrkH family potassium uptake protein, partial [Rhizobiales bacterium]|nr:TrkH family potassium uptake protein [Hyphomicrobiales bacterium]